MRTAECGTNVKESRRPHFEVYERDICGEYKSEDECAESGSSDSCAWNEDLLTCVDSSRQPEVLDVCGEYEVQLDCEEFGEEDFCEWHSDTLTCEQNYDEYYYSY